MSKYTRKKDAGAQAAPDQFIGFWQRTSNLLIPMLPRLGLVLLGAIVLVIAVWGVSQISAGRKEKATAALTQALRIRSADLKTDKSQAEAEPQDVPRFATAKERAEATLRALDDLVKEHGGTDAALRGQLVRASVLYELGRLEEADAAFRRFLDRKLGDPLLMALAREGLGLCAEGRGQLDNALLIYREHADDFHKDRFLLNQARVLGKKGDKKKAIELYKELLAKFPHSPLREDVNNRLLALED